MSEVKKKKTWNQTSAIQSAIRRIFSRSPIVNEVLHEGRRTKPRYKKDGSRHRVDAVEYSCQVCNSWVNSTHVEVDHIAPVVDPEKGFVNYDVYVERLFCDKKNLQRICEDCHLKKSNIENSKRRLVKDTAALDILEKKLKSKITVVEVPELKKQLSKYVSKTKADIVRNRAIQMREELKRIKL